MHRPSASDDLRSPERRRWLKQAGQLAIAGGLLAGGGWAVLKRKQNLWQVRRERTLMQTSVAVTCLADDVQAAADAIAPIPTAAITIATAGTHCIYLVGFEVVGVIRIDSLHNDLISFLRVARSRKLRP